MADTKAWAIKGPRWLHIVHLGRKKDCIREFVEGGEPMRPSEVIEGWAKLKKEGYRVVRVRVVEEEAGR